MEKEGISDYSKDEIFFIYFIGMLNDSIIKIGISNDPQKRLKELQVANPYELRLIFMFRGDESKEIQLHEKFVEYNIRGEWFYNIGKLKEYVNQILRTIDEKGNIPKDGMTPKERAISIIGIIKELSPKMGGQVSIFMIISEANKQFKIEQEDAETTIQGLRQRGLIFEPVHGYLKTV